MIQTIIRLDKKEKAKIEALAEATGKSMQAIMREAVQSYLKRKPAQIAMGNKIIAAREGLRGKD